MKKLVVIIESGEHHSIQNMILSKLFQGHFDFKIVVHDEIDSLMHNDFFYFHFVNKERDPHLFKTIESMLQNDKKVIASVLNMAWVTSDSFFYFENYEDIVERIKKH